MEAKENFEVPTSKISSRALVLIAIGVIALILAEFLGAPGRATVGYVFASILIKLISYSLILMIIAAGISGLRGKFKTHTLVLFGWLLLVAAVFDLGVVAYRKFVVEPEVRRTLERINRQR